MKNKSIVESAFRYRFSRLDNLTHQFTVMVQDITSLSFGYQNTNLWNFKLEEHNKGLNDLRI